MEHNKDTTVAETSATQWHPAFFGSLQIEFEKEADKLIFESEHQLSTKPMAIDVLIIKKISNEPIKKNIGRIFRKHNIIEYKSPDDYLSIDDFYKVYGYACFYKYDISITNEIKITDLTISFVCEGYPRKLIRHLETTKKYKISKHGNGIYYVEGDIIPIQIIVKKKLSTTENLWLASLTNSLREKETAKKLLNVYNQNRTKPLYRSVMNTIVTTNHEIFEEGKDMCQALEEILDRKIQKENARINALTLKLAELDRIDDIIEAAKSPDYQSQLMTELGI